VTSTSRARRADARARRRALETRTRGATVDAFAGIGLETDGARALAGASAVVLAGAIWAYNHFQREFVVADALSALVSGGRSLQLGADTKLLYYYPRGTTAVVVVDERVNEGLVNRIGIERKLVVIPRSAPIAGSGARAETFWGERAASVDSVVSASALSALSDDELAVVARKAASVIRPGGRFVFIESASVGARLVRALESTGSFDLSAGAPRAAGALLAGALVRANDALGDAPSKDVIPRRGTRRRA